MSPSSMSSLYCAHFRLEEAPFSVTPDPCFVYMSAYHREALGHLLYGLGEGGGFVQLTGEVGTGKTTICRTLLSQLPEDVNVALIFNPKLTVTELLQTICEELHIETPPSDTSTKAYIDRLFEYLLEANANRQRTILIVDEAQNLSCDVLEQIRLLTNLETNNNKLLQIFLIGQPELRKLLERDDLRQLAQRVTARYHLEPLSRAETEQYIRHRLSVAGCERQLFTPAALHRIYRLTGGIPRLINSLCDRALLGAYTSDRERIDARIVRRAHRELSGEGGAPWKPILRFAATGCAAGAAIAALLVATDFGREFLPGRSTPAHVAAPNPSEVEPSRTDRAVPNVARAATPDPGQIRTARGQSEAVQTQADDSSVTRVSSVPDEMESLPGGAMPQPRFESSAAGDWTGSQPGARLVATAKTSPYHSIGGLLKTVGSDASRDAEARLFALWGIAQPPVDGDICAQAAEQGLECFAKSGSWDKLRGFDLPALLTLRRNAGETVSVLLTGLGGHHATVYLGHQQHTFRLYEVDRYWTGDYLLLWKPPFERVTVIHPSHIGAPVQWLRSLFARVDGIRLEQENFASFDAELSERVKDFQRRRGLYADGIVGPETFIHLSTIVPDPDKPTLSPAAVSASPGAKSTVAYFDNPTR